MTRKRLWGNKKVGGCFNHNWGEEGGMRSARMKTDANLLQPGMSLPTPDEVKASKDIIHELFGKHVVGLGDVVVKYGHIDLKEAEAMSFVRNHTTVPVPRVLGTYVHDDQNYLFMDRVPGKTLRDCLKNNELGPDDLQSLADEMKGYLDQMRSLRVTDCEGSEFIGSVGRKPCLDFIFTYGMEENGPFLTEEDMHDNILRRYGRGFEDSGDCYLDLFRGMVQRMLKEHPHKICFTHADLASRNIMIENGHISGIIDWGQAGWYPEYWEYVKLMWGGKYDWQTKWPLYFDHFMKRYDYERLIDKELRMNFR
jgi:aminoglycoside phosphotransferase